MKERVERAVAAIEAAYDANGGSLEHFQLAEAVLDSIEPAQLSEAVEFDEDTIMEILVGGRWIAVARERRAVGGYLPQPDGWLVVALRDGTDLIVRERDVTAVRADYRDAKATA